MWATLEEKVRWRALAEDAEGQRMRSLYSHADYQLPRFNNCRACGGWRGRMCSKSLELVLEMNSLLSCLSTNCSAEWDTKRLVLARNFVQLSTSPSRILWAPLCGGRLNSPAAQIADKSTFIGRLALASYPFHREKADCVREVVRSAHRYHRRRHISHIRINFLLGLHARSCMWLQDLALGEMLFCSSSVELHARSVHSEFRHGLCPGTVEHLCVNLGNCAIGFTRCVHHAHT